MAPIPRPNPNDWDQDYVSRINLAKVVREAIVWDKGHRGIQTVSKKLWIMMHWPNPAGGTYDYRVIGHEQAMTQALLVLHVKPRATLPLFADSERLTRAIQAVKEDYLHMVPDLDGYTSDDDVPAYDNDFEPYLKNTPLEAAKNKWL